MAAATLLFETKRLYDDGRVMHVRIWLVGAPVRGSSHSFKYSLFYRGPGERLVGYDNDPDKGDHRHYSSREETYKFTTVEQLVLDFLADIAALNDGES
jgi:hypothetical protein